MSAADVIPFIPIEGVTVEECVKLAERVGNDLWKKLKVPVYFYEAAAKKPERTNLENIRRGQFEALQKEMGTVRQRAIPIAAIRFCIPQRARRSSVFANS